MSRRTVTFVAGGLAVAAVAAALVIGYSSDPVRATVVQSIRNDPTTSAPQTLQALPPAARSYVDAVEARNLDALVASFHPDGLIVDVGREIRGHEAIRHWAASEVIGGRLTVLRETPRENGTTMLVVFAPGGSGGFRANYAFDIADGLITKAALTYAD